VCDHPSSHVTDDYLHCHCFCGPLSTSSPLILAWAILQYVCEKMFFSSFSNSSFCFHQSRIIFSVECGPKCLSAAILLCSFANFITFNLNATLYENHFCLADLHISPCCCNRKCIQLTTTLATEQG
jgi:hypothetical protein